MGGILRKEKISVYLITCLLVLTVLTPLNVSAMVKNMSKNNRISYDVRIFDVADTVADEENNASIHQYNGGCRYNIQGWIYVYIQGEPYTRGVQYGYLLAEEIVDLINRWSNMIHNHPLIKPLSKHFSQEKHNKISRLWWSFCKSQCTKVYGDKFNVYNEYKQEIRGIADGVNLRGCKVFGENVTYEDILTLNLMYEFLSKITYNALIKGFHPFYSLYHGLQKEVVALSRVKPFDFILDFVDYPVYHKCNGFIATGNATTHGQIVIANSMWSTSSGLSGWWWSYYITFRWNIILDVNPIQGCRFIMASAPGYIWSDHDFYQNKNGIVFLETTNPQGFWDNKGLPLVIRARTAVQYSNSIDDVVHYLKDKNDGCMNAIWLIGDTKTGEIARFELGYKHSWINRTFNGFHWSSNNPFDLKVRLEKIHLKNLFGYLVFYLLFKSKNIVFELPRYHPSPRDLKFEELGKKHYGHINVDVVKEIMSTDPIVSWSPDCKITDSFLLKHNGLEVFIGNPAGRNREIINLEHPTPRVEIIPPAGWVKIYGLPMGKEKQVPYKPCQQNSEPLIKWKYNTKVETNLSSTSNIIKNKILYSTTSNGQILALNTSDGMLIWNDTIGGGSTAPVLIGDRIFVGTIKGLETFDINWRTHGVKPLGEITGKPVATDGKIFAGNKEGKLYALDVETGDVLWNITLPGEVYISNSYMGVIFVASGTNCYAVDIENGDILWSFNTTGVITSPPYTQDGIVYFGSWDTNLYAVYAGNGTLKWRYETGWGVEITPVLSNDLVFIGSHDNNFYAIYKNNGTLKWFFTCKAGIHSSPVTNNKFVLFGCDDGCFYCLNKTDGGFVWSFSPGKKIQKWINYDITPILSNSAVDDETVYLGVNNFIYALIL